MVVWLLLPVLGVTELRQLTEPDNQGSDSFLWGARVGEQEVCFPEGYAFPGVGKA